MLCNAVSSGGVRFPRKSITKVYGSTLLGLLPGGGWVYVKFPGSFSYMMY